MNENHPLDSLLNTAMNSLREMIDVNTIMGDPVETPDGTVIIPISKVALGFAAGGSDWPQSTKSDTKLAPDSTTYGSDSNDSPAFGGGSGAGMSLLPVGFLVVNNGNSRFLPASGDNPWSRLVDIAPDIISKMTAKKRSAHSGQTADPMDTIGLFDDADDTTLLSN